MTLEERTVALALHYLGATSDNENTLIVKKAYALCAQNAIPQVYYRVLKLNSTLPNITFCNSDIAFCSKDLARHLNGASGAIAVAHTLGGRIDILQEKLNQSDMSFAVTFNAVCSAYAEVVADDDVKKIQQTALPQGSSVNARYCAGYGDFDARHNLDLLNLIGTRSGFIAVEKSGALLPRKSMVGLCGVFENTQTDKVICTDANSSLVNGSKNIK